MRNRIQLAAIVLTAASLVGCEPPEPGRQGAGDLQTDEQKASYAIGVNFGGNLTQAEGHLDLDALMLGIEDALAEREPRVGEEETQRVMNALNETIQAEMEAEREVEAAENREEGEAYLAENAQRDEVTVTDTGLQYEVLEEGDGPMPGPEDRVTIHYRGTLIDGTEFDSSYERGEPATFGVGQVIPGFSEGLQLMPVGSTYRFVIPSDAAYGPQGSPPTIGPDETLIFEVELIEIQGQG